MSPDILALRLTEASTRILSEKKIVHSLRSIGPMIVGHHPGMASGSISCKWLKDVQGKGQLCQLNWEHLQQLLDGHLFPSNGFESFVSPWKIGFLGMCDKLQVSDS